MPQTLYRHLAQAKQVRTNEENELFFELKDASPDKKSTNYATVIDDTIIFSNGVSSYVLLEPATKKHPKTWIVQVKGANAEEHKQALEATDCFLQYGFKVLFVYGNGLDFANTIKKHEYSENLCYETTQDMDKSKLLKGLNVNVYSGISLISQLIKQSEFDSCFDLSKIDDFSYLNSHEITVKNFEWSSIEEVEKRNKIEPLYPLEAWGELSELIKETSNSSHLSYGMIGTKLLGVFGCVFKDVNAKELPLLTFTLVAADPNRGKDRLTKYLYKPVAEYQERERIAFDEFKKENKDTTASEPPRYFVSSIGSFKGVLRLMGGKSLGATPSSLTIQNTEAEGFFVGLGKGDELQASLSALCAFWVGDPPSYLTKDISIEFDSKIRLSLDLMTQPKPFSELLSNSMMWDRGFLNRFILYKEKEPDYNNVQIQSFNQESIAYQSYSSKMSKFITMGKFIKISLSEENKNFLSMKKNEYDKRKGNLYYDYLNYQNNTVSGFAGRAYEHILRIACFLAIYESEPKDILDFVHKEKFHRDNWKKYLPEEGEDKIAFSCSKNEFSNDIKKEAVTVEKIHLVRASIIFEYHVQHLISIMLGVENDERYLKLLEGLYNLNEKGLTLTTSLLQQKKIVRQTANPNFSVRAEELNEMLRALADLGFVKIVQDGKRKIIRLHPSYNPKS